MNVNYSKIKKRMKAMAKNKLSLCCDSYIFETVKANRKIMVIIFTAIIVLLVGCAIRLHASYQSKGKAAVVTINVPKNDFSESLNDITEKLANLEKKLNADGAVVNVQSIESDLQKIHEQSNRLAKGSNELIRSQIKQSNEQLSKKIDGLTEELSSLKEEKKQTKFLKPADLPYQVVSVDNIQQQNVVTVSYDNTVFPMDVGDYLANWKLISANFTSQKAEFVNKKGQHIVIDLNRITQRGQNA